MKLCNYCKNIATDKYKDFDICLECKKLNERIASREEYLKEKENDNR